MTRGIIGAALALGMAASQALAQTAARRTTRSQAVHQANAASQAADHSFVMDAARGGMAEVELGRLAAEKASSDNVKKFGQRMVDDHSKANDELKDIAQKQDITLPTQLSAKDKALRDRLSKLSGPAFDRAYMNAMVRDHRHDVAAFKHEANSGRNPEVKAFAAKTVPTLEQHLQLAQSTHKEVVATSGTGAAGKTGTTGSRPTGAKRPATAAPAPRNQNGK